MNQDGAEADAAAAPRGFAAVVRACRQVFGIPDYARYVEHMQRHHPGAALMTEREFFAHAIDRKYGRNGPRCC